MMTASRPWLGPNQRLPSDIDVPRHLGHDVRDGTFAVTPSVSCTAPRSADGPTSASGSSDCSQRRRRPDPEHHRGPARPSPRRRPRRGDPRPPGRDEAARGRGRRVVNGRPYAPTVLPSDLGEHLERYRIVAQRARDDGRRTSGGVASLRRLEHRRVTHVPRDSPQSASTPKLCPHRKLTARGSMLDVAVGEPKDQDRRTRRHSVSLSARPDALAEGWVQSGRKEELCKRAQSSGGQWPRLRGQKLPLAATWTLVLPHERHGPWGVRLARYA